MKILIVGGLGYIGGRLACSLSRLKGWKICLSTRRESKDIPAWADDFEVFRMDVRDNELVDNCIRTIRPDAIIHLGNVDDVTCLKHPEMAFEVNVEGTSRLLERAYHYQVSRFIFFSSFHVYGELSGDVMEQFPVSPVSLYAKTKLAAEESIKKYTDGEKFKTLILRLSNGYGYAKDSRATDRVWTLVFNSFCKQAIEEGRITIRCDQYRDFISLEDVARAVHHFLHIVPGAWQDGVFNLGGDQCLRVSQVAQKISDCYEKLYRKGPLHIEGPLEGKNRVFKDFHYNINKLKGTGFRFCGDMETEIIGTLRLCEAAA